jgi:hypothetical protein
MARNKRQRAAPLERFDRVEGFDATGVSGTVVAVASDAVTVQPDSVGAQPSASWWPALGLARRSSLVQ